MFVLVEWNGFLSGLHFCRSCMTLRKVRLSDDIGVVVHWVGEHMFFDIVLRFKDCKVSYVLYREVYVAES